MLALDFIRENTDLVKIAISDKGIGLDLDEFITIDDERRALIVQVDQFRQSQNEFNKKVQKLSGDERESAINDMKALSNDLKDVEVNLKKVEKKWLDLYLMIPNIASDDSPVGEDEKSNIVVEKWGDKPVFDFEPKSHLELVKSLDLADFEQGVKVSGFRGYYLKNEAAVLHFSLLFYAFKKMIEAGFAPMMTPTILKEFALIGSGHFPFGKDDVYSLANTGKDAGGNVVGDELYLAGTSEPALLAYYADKTLKEGDLPVKVCGFSQCYRNEVGSYGKDVKGLYRIHEFMKVEQVVLCRDSVEESNKYLEEMRNISQEILKDLKLPHRVVQICTGDMGAGKYKMYDIETAMPVSRESGYGETHSDSNLTDWQSRRLNIKFEDKEGNKKYVYALNNTVLASPRILIAILENFQTKEGTVKIPDVLKSYCGFDEIRPKN